MKTNFTQKKLEEFDERFSESKYAKTQRAFLSESIEQAYQEGLKETAISMDKKGKEWLKSNATEAVDLLKEIREQAATEGAKGKFFNTVEIKERINIPKEIIEQISQEARAEEKERIKNNFIHEFCNDHNGEVRWLRSVAIDMPDLLEMILDFFNNQDK